MRKSLLATLEFPPQRGGTQSYYFNVCKNLPSEKIVVLAPKTSERCPIPYRVSDTLDSTDFKIYRKNLLAKYLYPHWLPMVMYLRKIIKKENIELIQVGQVLPCGTAAFLINKIFNIPYIVYTHGLDILGPQKNPRKKKLMIKILFNAEKVISNSEFTKNEVAKLGIDKEKIFVVYPWVAFLPPRHSPLAGDCGGAYKARTFPRTLRGRGDGKSSSAGGGTVNPPPAPPREGGDVAPILGRVEELRKKYNLVNKKILLSVCRLVDRKGVDLVISALAKFSEELKDVVYVVVGDRPKMEDLERVVASNCCQLPDSCSQVVFAGRVSDYELDLWYRMSDVFILTPKKSEFDVEGFGIVYIEAGGYSKPVIGSRLAGICEAVEDGVTGILVEPDNIEQIGKTIVKLFSDEGQRERLGRQGRERVEREFVVEKQIENLKEIL